MENFCSSNVDGGIKKERGGEVALGALLVLDEGTREPTVDERLRDHEKDGTNGYLIPPFDLDAYAEKLAQLMSNSELRERLARNAQESVAKFSPDAIGDKWTNLLREVVGENP